MKTKKVKASGRFGPRYGTRVRSKITIIEEKQRKRQVCPFCKKQKAKRLAKGIWLCAGCRKKFASSAFYIEN